MYLNFVIYIGIYIVHYGWFPTYRGANVEGGGGQLPSIFWQNRRRRQAVAARRITISPPRFRKLLTPLTFVKSNFAIWMPMNLLIFHNIRLNLKNKFRGCLCFLLWQTCLKWFFWAFDVCSSSELSTCFGVHCFSKAPLLSMHLFLCCKKKREKMEKTYKIRFLCFRCKNLCTRNIRL